MKLYISCLSLVFLSASLGCSQMETPARPRECAIRPLKIIGWPSKPPMVALSMDVEFSNSAGTPLWAVLPCHINTALNSDLKQHVFLWKRLRQMELHGLGSALRTEDLSS